jgi:hypothetical protein
MSKEQWTQTALALALAERVSRAGSERREAGLSSGDVGWEDDDGLSVASETESI